MEPAMESRRASWLSGLMAGLQAGMLAACWMLLWLGLGAVWQRRSFWTSENLMASAFYGDLAIRRGFAARTLSGLALYLLLYSVLGALFGMLVSNRLARLWVLLVSILFGLSWYYLSFQLLWKSVLPLVALLHAPEPTALGHLIYGAVLARYPSYLPAAEEAPVADATPEVEAAPEVAAPAAPVEPPVSEVPFESREG